MLLLYVLLVRVDDYKIQSTEFFPKILTTHFWGQLQ